MANEVDVGGIVVRLIADAKQLEASLAKASGDFRKFGSNADKANRQAAKAADNTVKAINAVVSRITGLVAAYVGVTSAIDAFNQAMTNVTQLDSLSQATGVAVERLSELRNVALATGVDFNVLSQAMSQFGARMTEGLASPTSRTSQAIRALGIDVRDAQGNLRSFEDVMLQAAERFPNFADGANKAALASSLFGEEAGPKLVALLNRGKAGIEALQRQIGSTFTAADAENVRKYNQAMAELQVQFERAILPSLTKAAELMTRLARLPATVSQLISETSPAADAVRARIELLNKELERHLKLNAGGHESNERFAEVQARITAEIERQTLLLRELNRERDRNSIGPWQTTTNLPQAPAMDPLALEKAQFALDQMMERLLGQRDIFDSINLSWQEHANVVTQALAQINRVHEAGFRRERAIAQMKAALRRQEVQQVMDVASQAAATITALWPKQKGAAIAAAIINTAVGVTNALRTGAPPWNFAMAALVAAQGAAQIAAIRSTNETGSSGAGAGSVQAPEPVEAAPSRSLTINGVDPGAIFSGGQVRGLIDLINDEVRNGATLISSGRLAA